jgi:hypothetical protein
VSAQRTPTAVNLGFLHRSRYFSFRQFLSYPHDADPLLRKSSSAENRIRILWMCGQELWPLDERGGPSILMKYVKNIRNYFDQIVDHMRCNNNDGALRCDAVFL